MQESKNLITYKWHEGVYSLEDLLILVKYKKLTPDEFFDLTRLNYEGLLKIKTEKGECT